MFQAEVDNNLLKAALQFVTGIKGFSVFPLSSLTDHFQVCSACHGILDGLSTIKALSDADVKAADIDRAAGMIATLMSLEVPQCITDHFEVEKSSNVAKVISAVKTDPLAKLVEQRCFACFQKPFEQWAAVVFSESGSTEEQMSDALDELKRIASLASVPKLNSALEIIGLLTHGRCVATSLANKWNACTCAEEQMLVKVIEKENGVFDFEFPWSLEIQRTRSALSKLQALADSADEGWKKTFSLKGSDGDHVYGMPECFHDLFALPDDLEDLLKEMQSLYNHIKDSWLAWMKGLAETCKDGSPSWNASASKDEFFSKEHIMPLLSNPKYNELKVSSATLLAAMNCSPGYCD